MKTQKTNWIALGVYAALATLISGLFRDGPLNAVVPADGSLILILIVVAIVVGWGPALAAGISWFVFGRQNRTSSLFGSWTSGAVIMSVIPAAVFAAYGYPNDFGMNAHLAGGLIGGLIFLYALGEEIGWRGYMHDALSPRPLLVRTLVIGLVWWAWHLFFLSSIAPNYMLTTLIIILPTAFILSWLVSESRSWLSAAAFHSLGNIAFMATVLEMDSQRRFLIAGTAFAILLLIHQLWKRRKSPAAA